MARPLLLSPVLPSSLFVPKTLRPPLPSKPQTRGGGAALTPVLRPSKSLGQDESPHSQQTPLASFGA